MKNLFSCRLENRVNPAHYYSKSDKCTEGRKVKSRDRVWGGSQRKEVGPRGIGKSLTRRFTRRDDVPGEVNGDMKGEQQPQKKPQ